MSASSSTISGLLPPSSSTIRFSPRPAVSPTTRPVFVDPVNEIMRTFGSSTSACPTSAPPPSTCRTPAGSPASSKMRAMITPPLTGVFGSLLSTTAVPERERRAERPHRQHDREVPGRDHADDADRHAAGGRRPPGRQRRQHVTERMRDQRGGLVELSDRRVDLHAPPSAGCTRTRAPSSRRSRPGGARAAPPRGG